MVPSRRYVIVTPSLRARRAAWRRSCHWRALRDPRVAVGRAGCRGDVIVQVAENSRDAGMPAVSSRGAWIAVHCALTSATREWPGQQPLHRLQRTEADGGPDCAAAMVVHELPRGSLGRGGRKFQLNATDARRTRMERACVGKHCTIAESPPVHLESRNLHDCLICPKLCTSTRAHM